MQMQICLVLYLKWKLWENRLRYRNSCKGKYGFNNDTYLSPPTWPFPLSWGSKTWKFNFPLSNDRTLLQMFSDYQFPMAKLFGHMSTRQLWTFLKTNAYLRILKRFQCTPSIDTITPYTKIKYFCFVLSICERTVQVNTLFQWIAIRNKGMSFPTTQN